MADVDLNITVTGLRELLAEMQVLPEKIQGKAMRHALHAGAKVVKEAARNHHPWQDDTGFLRSAIVQFNAKKSDHPYSEQVRIGVLKRRSKRPSKQFAAARSRKQRKQKAIGVPYYWRFLEFGTSRMSAKPFMRPAFESNKSQALELINATMRAEIDRAVKGP